jgi:hypothetical protein
MKRATRLKELIVRDYKIKNSLGQEISEDYKKLLVNLVLKGHC